VAPDTDLVDIETTVRTVSADTDEDVGGEMLVAAKPAAVPQPRGSARPARA
jgi:hypothetical protein